MWGQPISRILVNCLNNFDFFVNNKCLMITFLCYLRLVWKDLKMVNQNLRMYVNYMRSIIVRVNIMGLWSHLAKLPL